MSCLLAAFCQTVPTVAEKDKPPRLAATSWYTLPWSAGTSWYTLPWSAATSSFSASSRRVWIQPWSVATFWQVAAVCGYVVAADHGWIHTLLEEAENEEVAADPSNLSGRGRRPRQPSRMWPPTAAACPQTTARSTLSWRRRRTRKWPQTAATCQDVAADRGNLPGRGRRPRLPRRLVLLGHRMSQM